MSQLTNSNEVKCPRCGSNQITANKKGFSGKKAVAGAVVTGGFGLIAGTIGSNKIKITCLSCGAAFAPGAGLKADQPTQIEKQKKDMEELRELSLIRNSRKEFMRQYKIGNGEQALEKLKEEDRYSTHFRDAETAYNSFRKAQSSMGVVVVIILIVIVVLVVAFAD